MARPDYELHKLGWQAFQDLCGVVLQEILGQTFTTFADTNDAGQDGAFHGVWAVPDDAPIEERKDFASAVTPVVVQCKFSAEPSGTLTPSDLKDELAKIEGLRARGLCDGYIVLTNLRVTGETRAWFDKEVRSSGVDHALILPGTWICTQIEKNWNLRRYVPRVYGLGDLSRILDERRMRQARALLTSLTHELETFVPTSAYRAASDAITNQGLALLLGEPASGKSTIAAMLCMGALDGWRCDVMRVSSPAELIEHWDPDDPRQMFWIDDAFGCIRHEPHLTDEWARYSEARPRLKDYAFPRLREQQVVIDVTDLSATEKQQMLYNHLKAGDQPAEVLGKWRPHLHAVSTVDRFQPEIARRLSLRGFMPTAGLHGKAQLMGFFEHPNEFLADVLDGLEPAQHAALAAVYLSGGELLAPFTPDSTLSVAVDAMGTTVAETSRAFAAIEGTFLVEATRTDGNTVWRFHHPTIREGFAATVMRNISTLPVYLEGMTTDELVSQLDCGGKSQRGTLVRVPPNLYHLIISRVPVPVPDRSELSRSPLSWFLRTRCSDEFLRMWAKEHEDAIPGMTDFGMMVEAFCRPWVLSRLHETGALTEVVRRRAVKQIAEYGIDDLDPAWGNSSLSGLFTTEERADLLQRVQEEVLPTLEQRIGDYAGLIISDMTNEELYQEPRDYVDAVRSAFQHHPDIQQLCDRIDRVIDDWVYDYRDESELPAESSGLAAPALNQIEAANPRDLFEDIAAGH